MDLRHKVLRTDNCLDMLRNLHPNDVNNELIGNIVITHHNRKTYKVNDIDYTMNPLKTFELLVNGEKVVTTFAEYYSNKFGLAITDNDQPLLVHRPKRKDRHRGQKGPILLIPELCNLTGLSTGQRGDHKLMRDVHRITSLDPSTRVTSLSNFTDRLFSSPEVQKKLLEWGMKLDKRMAKVTGRKLDPEELILGTRSFTAKDNADWTHDLKGSEWISTS